MSKEVRRAYRLLHLKDSFDAVADSMFKIAISVMVAAIAVIAAMGTRSVWFTTVPFVAAVLSAAVYFLFRVAYVVCDVLLRHSGFSEIQLESWGLS